MNEKSSLVSTGCLAILSATPEVPHRFSETCPKVSVLGCAHLLASQDWALWAQF
jgi:hypothetical protein